MSGKEMTFDEFSEVVFADWLIEMRTVYVDERIAAGDAHQEAEKNADSAFERLLPGGVPAPGQLIGRVLCGDQPVGKLWVGPAGADPQRWWIWDIAISDGQRGRGYGRQAMLLAEEVARAHGATTIGLNVFAHNSVARSLYLSLSYRETSVQMRKEL